MPLLSRVLIKVSLIFLVIGVTAGIISASSSHVAAAALRIPAYHALTVGWLTQLVFGVAYWLFPRFSRERPYGTDGYLPAAFVLLNVGLLLRVVAEPMAFVQPAAAWRMAIVASAVIQTIATVGFARYFWTRVKPK